MGWHDDNHNPGNRKDAYTIVIPIITEGSFLVSRKAIRGEAGNKIHKDYSFGSGTTEDPERGIKDGVFGHVFRCGPTRKDEGKDEEARKDEEADPKAPAVVAFRSPQWHARETNSTTHIGVSMSVFFTLVPDFVKGQKCYAKCDQVSFGGKMHDLYFPGIVTDFEMNGNYAGEKLYRVKFDNSKKNKLPEKTITIKFDNIIHADEYEAQGNSYLGLLSRARAERLKNLKKEEARTKLQRLADGN